MYSSPPLLRAVWNCSGDISGSLARWLAARPQESVRRVRHTAQVCLSAHPALRLAFNGWRIEGAWKRVL